MEPYESIGSGMQRYACYTACWFLLVARKLLLRIDLGAARTLAGGDSSNHRSIKIENYAVTAVVRGWTFLASRVLPGCFCVFGSPAFCTFGRQDQAVALSPEQHSHHPPPCSVTLQL